MNNEKSATATIEETETRQSPLYKVLLHNDSVNDMDTVIKALQTVFKFDNQQACIIMMEAHVNDVALVKVEPLEQAEFHKEQMHSYNLTVTIEKE